MSETALEIARLPGMTVGELRTRYVELFGDETKTGNKPWLVKRIAWRLQSIAEGGLSDRARRRAEELANEADLRLSPPRIKAPPAEVQRVETCTTSDSAVRLPPPGTVLARDYKGKTLLVLVLPNGFEFEGEVHRSLSAVAKKITGTHCNGFHFFRLRKKGGDA
jgi:hypothetical protein